MEIKKSAIIFLFLCSLCFAASDQELTGNLKMVGSANELRFYEGVNYVGFEAGILSANQIWVLPVADGTSGQVLITSGGGTLSFTDVNGGGGGDMFKSVYDADGDGDIDVVAGGTEKSSWTQYAIPYLDTTTSFSEIAIGTASQYLQVAAGATGYQFDTLTHADIDFTGWTGVSSITTLGTITTGTWSATDIVLAAGGTGASLSDPGADRIFFWDDGGTTTAFLTANTNISISGTNLNIDDAFLVNNASDITTGVITSAGITITTGNALTLGTTQWDDGSDKIEGNILADDSVDEDALDFTSITLADFTDDLGEDSGHTHTGTTLSAVDISDDTNLTAGTNITLTGDTLDVDDAFLVNDANDTTTGILTAAGFVGDITGNSDTATALETARNITMTGDVSWTVSFDGSANVTAAGTIQPDSVALTTDTTGNYVTSVATTSPLNGGAAGSEGAVLTLTIDDANDDGGKGAASFDATDFDDDGSGGITIVDDGHLHTGTSLSSIDISDDTNLAVTAPITLTDDTVGITVAKDIVAGVGLSGGENDVLPGADADTTLTFDATEIDAPTWSDGSNASNIWTYDVSGTDHTMTAGNGLMTFSHDVNVVGTITAGTLTDGSLIITGGDITIATGKKAIFRDPQIYVTSDSDGIMDLHADSSIHINSPTALITGALFIGPVDNAFAFNVTEAGSQVLFNVDTSSEEVFSFMPLYVRSDETDALVVQNTSETSTLTVDPSNQVVKIDNNALILSGGSITDTSNAIDFGNESLTTSGNITATGATITGGTLTDSTASLTGGNLTVIGTIGASGDSDLLSLASGVLTINGKTDIRGTEAGGFLVVGDGTGLRGTNPVITIDRTTDTATENAHGFEDWTVFEKEGSYNSFDSRYRVSDGLAGEFGDKHFIGFQAAQSYRNTNDALETLGGFLSVLTSTAGTTVNKVKHYSISDLFLEGDVTSQYGIHFEGTFDAATNNFVFYNTTPGTLFYHYGSIFFGTGTNSLSRAMIAHHSSNFLFMLGGSAGLKLTDDGLNGITIIDGGNVGINTVTPDTKLQVVGDSKFGDDNTNYLEIEADGTLELIGDATVFDDIRTPVTAIRITGPGGTTPPDEVLYKGSVVLAFGGAGTDDEKAFFIIQIPHWYKEGSDITPHIHWVPEDNTAGNVRWILTYSWANIDANFPAETTDAIEVAADQVTDKHQRDNFSVMTGTGKTISSMILCSIQREDSDANDTFDNKDAYLTEIDFHAEKDTMGSRLIADDK